MEDKPAKEESANGTKATPIDSAADDEDGYMGKLKPENKKDDNGSDEDDDEIADVEAALHSGVKRAISQTWHAPDGGWGWVIVICGLVVSLIVDGLTYTFGLFLGQFEKAFNAPKSTIALASSLQVGIYLMIGPIVSALTNRFGCRPVIIAGSLIASAAFIISSFSPGVLMLIVTYGVFGGIGFGMMYLPAIVAVSLYFEQKRAVATGIAVCGSGIGTFVLAPVTELLLEEYNWRWTLMILGAIILNGVVFGALVRPLETMMSKATDKGQQIAEDMVSEILKQQSRKSIDGHKVIKDAAAGDLLEFETTLPLVSQTTKQKKKRKISTTSSGVQVIESVPLITITDEQEKTTVFPTGTVTKAQTAAKKNNNNIRSLFSSTPTLPLSPPAVGRSASISNASAKSAPRSRVRSNTISTTGLLKTQSTPPLQQKRRSHAPIGLAYISLSDFQLNKLRDDVHLPLSRKDVHLSGAITSPEWDYIGDTKRTEMYLQSVRSLASNTSVENYQKDQAKGLWKCVPESARETLEEMLNLGILKDTRYWFVLLGNFFCMIGFYVPFVYIPETAKLMGIEESKTAFLLSIIGISNTVGRVLTGVFVNFFNIDSLVVNNIALFLCGVMTIVCPLCTTYEALAGVSAVFGLCVAAYISLCSLLLCELLGVHNLTNAFGFVILFRGVACIIGPPVAGALIDATGVFDPAFYVGGGFIVLGALSHFMLHTPCVGKTRKVG